MSDATNPIADASLRYLHRELEDAVKNGHSDDDIDDIVNLIEYVTNFREEYEKNE